MMIKNVIVDIGNYNFKYSGDCRGIFSSKYTTRFEPNKEAYERVELNGITTLIGIGELEREFDKSKKNIIPQVLYAIAMATQYNQINLCLLMPINQISLKDKLIRCFQGKSFSFHINGEVRWITINNCIVLPECQAAYYSLKNTSQYQLLIDIGSRTINWCAYQEGKLYNNGTEKLGIYDLYHRIMTIENAKGEEFNVECIEGQIKRGRIHVSNMVYKEFFIDVLNRIKTSVNLKDYDVVFLGGGSLVLKPIISGIEDVMIHPEAIYSNVIGAENVCSRMWRYNGSKI